VVTSGAIVGEVVPCTVKARVAVSTVVPEVPVKATVSADATAVDAAVSVVLCAVPGVRVSVGGFAVTLVGSPLIATVTVPVKPFTGTTFTLTCCPGLPATSVTVAGSVVSEKPAAINTSDTERLMQEERGRQRNRDAANKIRPIFGR
jgi:hypothetical protein